MQTLDTPTESSSALIGHWTIASLAVWLATILIEPLLGNFGIHLDGGPGVLIALFAGFAVAVWWPGWVKAGVRNTLLGVVIFLLVFGGFGVGVIWLITLGAS